MRGKGKNRAERAAETRSRRSVSLRTASTETATPDRAERRAIIGGALSAALLVGGILAASFAALIFVMVKVGMKMGDHISCHS